MDPFEQPQRPHSTPIPGSGSPPPPPPPFGGGHRPPASPYPAGWNGGPQQPVHGGYPPTGYPPTGYPPIAYPPTGYPPGMVPGPMGWGSSAPPGTNMVRRRRRVVLVIGLVFLLGGAGVATAGIIRLVHAFSIPSEDIVIRGRTDDAMAFTRGATDPERWTIYLDSNSSDSDVVDSQTAGTSCTVAYSDGTTGAVNGSRQTTSVSINGTASVGYFDAPLGPVSVTCNANGLYRYFVARGGPRLELSAFGLLFGGLGALVLGVVLTIIGVRRRWVAVPALG